MENSNALNGFITNVFTSLTEQVDTAYHNHAWITCIALAILTKIAALICIPIVFTATALQYIYYVCTNSESAGAFMVAGGELLDQLAFRFPSITLQHELSDEEYAAYLNLQTVHNTACQRLAQADISVSRLQIENQQLQEQLDSIEPQLDGVEELTEENQRLAAALMEKTQESMVMSASAQTEQERYVADLERRRIRQDTDIRFECSQEIDQGKEQIRTLTARLRGLEEENQQLHRQIPVSVQAIAPSPEVATTELSKVYLAISLQRIQRIKQDFNKDEQIIISEADYKRFQYPEKRELTTAPAERRWDAEDQKTVQFIEKFVQDMGSAQEKDMGSAQKKDMVLQKSDYAAFL